MDLRVRNAVSDQGWVNFWFYAKAFLTFSFESLHIE